MGCKFKGLKFSRLATLKICAFAQIYQKFDVRRRRKIVNLARAKPRFCIIAQNFKG